MLGPLPPLVLPRRAFLISEHLKKATGSRSITYCYCLLVTNPDETPAIRLLVHNHPDRGCLRRYAENGKHRRSGPCCIEVPSDLQRRNCMITMCNGMPAFSKNERLYHIEPHYCLSLSSQDFSPDELAASLEQSGVVIFSSPT